MRGFIVHRDEGGMEREGGGWRGRKVGGRERKSRAGMSTLETGFPFLGVCGLPARSIDYVCRQSCLFISHQFSQAA